MKQILLLIFVLGILTGIQAQTEVTGTITSEEGESLPGASVLEAGTTNGTITDVDGKFSLSVSEGASLTVSFVGYESQVIPMNGRSTINFQLYPDVSALEEVVVIGFGTQSRKTLTTAISKVGAERLENIPISNVGEGLKGKIAGVRVFSTNTAPGANPVIRIRGGSSIDGSDNPLILVDGVEMNFSDVNPHDIESIEVLKDAASTAIYGSRASNGVILVTTRRGKANQAPRITFQVTTARQEPERMYDFLNAEDYISRVRPIVAVSPSPERNDISGYSASSGNDNTSIYTTRYLADGESVPTGWKSMPDPLDPSKTLIFQDSDLAGILFSPAGWKDYYVGINGGSSNLKYNASIGYTNNEGIGLATGWDRISGRANVDARISNRLTFSTNLSYSHSYTDSYDNQRNVIARGLSTAPTHRLYWDDGTPAPGYNRTSPSPLWNNYVTEAENLDQRLSLVSTLDWNIIDELYLKVTGSYFTVTGQQDAFTRAHEFSGSREASSEFDQTLQSKLVGYLSYDKSFGDHNISVTAGYSFLDIHRKQLEAAAQGASTDKIITLNAAPTKNDATTNITDEVLIGYFGRISYNYKQKYLLSANMRRDGSSRFLPGNQWGVFPGVSAGWIISEENWFTSSAAFSSLKIRTSYGKTGNNAVGYYDAVGQYAANVSYQLNAGIRAASMPNGNLTWETSTQLDVGIDAGFFNNRINLMGDYFNKVTENLLFDKPLPNTSGFDDVKTNIGQVRFYGFEVDLSSTNIRKNDFEWTSNFTWSFVKSTVLKLPDNGRENNRIGGIVDPEGGDFGGIAEGEPLYRYYGHQVDHIIQTQDEADNALFDDYSRGFSPVDGQRIKGRKLPGDYEWVDRNGDGQITSLDQFLLGVTVPHTTGGLGNKLRFKDFTFNVYVDWALGHSINDVAFERYFMNTFAYNYALVEQAKDTWTPENPNATYARLTANDPGDGSNNFSGRRTSSKVNFKGDYLCIREVTINYNVPTSIVSKIGMEKLNVYVSGNNLHYFTALIGTSPEPGASTTYSGGYNNYPAIRRYSVGLSATF